MAGEYRIARECIDKAMSAAASDPAMSADSMASALLGTLLSHMLKSRTRADLASLVEFQLESTAEDEFVITRGC